MKPLTNTLICMCMAVLMAVPAHAQQAASAEPPVYDWHHSADLVEINAHMAVGISSVLQNYGSAIPGLSDFLLSPGCLMRPGVDVRFNLRNSLGLVTGLEFTINNSRFAMSLIDGNTSSISSVYVSNHFYDFTVPVYVSARLNIGRRMMWNADLGIYISYGLGGNIRASGYISGENSLGQPIVTHSNYEFKYFEDPQSYINGVRRVDYGPRLATGIIYRHRYTLNMVLQVGARNLAINYGVLRTRYRNLNLAFQFGYSF